MKTLIEEWKSDFTDFYTENINSYGTSESGIEKAYSDFVDLRGTDILESDLEFEFNQFLKGSKHKTVEDAFSEFCSLNDITEEELELADIFSDLIEGTTVEDYLKGASIDSNQLDSSADSNDEDEYSDVLLNRDFEVASAFLNMYSDDMTDEDALEIIDSLYKESNSEDLYSEDQVHDLYHGVEDSLEVISDHFADFYVENMTTYGRDIERAFADFTDNYGEFDILVTDVKETVNRPMERLSSELDKTIRTTKNYEDKVKEYRKSLGWDSESLVRRAIARGILVGVPLGLAMNYLNRSYNPDDIKILVKLVDSNRTELISEHDIIAKETVYDRVKKSFRIDMLGGFLLVSMAHVTKSLWDQRNGIKYSAKNNKSHVQTMATAQERVTQNKYGVGNPKSFNSPQPDPNRTLRGLKRLSKTSK